MRKPAFPAPLSLLLILSSFATTSSFGQAQRDAEWPVYGNDPGGMRYSRDAQITTSNVSNLKVAWSYRTGANDTPTGLKRKAAFEATPILVGGKLFLSTPYDHVIALDPETGTKLWEYDPGVNLNRNYSEVTSRGVSAWRDRSKKAGDQCRLRIFIGTVDARLIALDGDSGKVCDNFGANGTVDLNKDAAKSISVLPYSPAQKRSPSCRMMARRPPSPRSISS